MLRPLAVFICFALACGAATTAHAQETREKQAVKRMQQVLQKTQQENTVLAQEKAQLADRVARSEADIKAAKEEAAARKKQALALQSDAAGARREAALAKRDLAAYRKALDASRGQMQKLVQDSEAYATKAREREEAVVKAANERILESQALVQNTRDELAAARREASQLNEKVAALERQVAEQKQQFDGVRRTLSDRNAVATRELQSCQDKNNRLYSLNGEIMQRYRNKGVWEALKQAEPFAGLKAAEQESLIQELQDRADEARAAPGAK